MIAITGTPGVGKTAVAEELRRRGYAVTSVVELAKKHDCIIDEVDGELVIDVEELASKLDFDGIVEGHLSHLLNPDVVIVLRCNPLILKQRLMARSWSYEKVMDNVEAELLDVILIEALESCDHVYEIDATSMSVAEVANAVEEILAGKGAKYKPGKVDWLSELGDKLDEVARFG